MVERDGCEQCEQTGLFGDEMKGKGKKEDESKQFTSKRLPIN